MTTERNIRKLIGTLSANGVEALYHKEIQPRSMRGPLLPVLYSLPNGDQFWVMRWGLDEEWCEGELVRLEFVEVTEDAAAGKDIIFDYLVALAEEVVGSGRTWEIRYGLPWNYGQSHEMCLCVTAAMQGEQVVDCYQLGGPKWIPERGYFLLRRGRRPE
jgi:hypothetical protein